MSRRQRTPKVQAPGLSVDVAPFKCPASCQLPVTSATYQEALGEAVHLWERTECHQLPEWITWICTWPFYFYSTFLEKA